LEFQFGKPINDLSSQLQLILRQIQKASSKTNACTSVKWYTIPTDTEQEAGDVIYDTLGFTGTSSSDSFTIYLDNEGTGAKVYNLYVKNLTGSLTLTTGFNDAEDLIISGGTYTGSILVDTLGNISLQSSTIAVNETGVTPSGTANTITVGGETYNLGGGGGSGSGIPLASITAYYGATDPADKNWLICDGRDTTGTDIELETYYPSLYEFLGGSNILPDLRECVPVGTGQNSTFTIGNHDIYTLGQFKDDQFQGHEHRMYNVSASWDNRNSRVSGGSWIYNLTTKDTGDIIDKANYGTARYGTTTHGKQVGVNWIIKATSSSDTYIPPSEEILQIEQYFDNGINKVKPDVYYWNPAVASATIPNIDNYDMVVLQMSYNNEAYTGAFSLIRNSDEDEVTMDIDSTNSTYKSKFKWSTGEITRVSQSLSIKYAICYPKNIFNSITKMN
jgi:microcystin-dependent protein